MNNYRKRGRKEGEEGERGRKKGKSYKATKEERLKKKPSGMGPSRALKF